MVTLDDDIIISGSSDGKLRMISLNSRPKEINVVASHSYNDSIEKIATGCQNNFAGTIGLDNTLRLWDMDNLYDALKKNVYSYSSKRKKIKMYDELPVKKRQFFRDLM